MLSEDFDAITVQQVLDRADVSRSTFYTHFRNTDDLLLTDAERFLAALEVHFLKASIGTRRVAPVAELLHHVREFREFLHALERAGKKEIIHDLFVGHFARLIEKRVRTLVADADAMAIPVPVVSRMFAGAMMALLNWSLDRDATHTPAWADERFHSMVWYGIQTRGCSDG